MRLFLPLFNFFHWAVPARLGSRPSQCRSKPSRIFCPVTTFPSLSSGDWLPWERESFGGGFWESCCGATEALTLTLSYTCSSGEEASVAPQQDSQKPPQKLSRSHGSQSPDNNLGKVVTGQKILEGLLLHGDGLEPSLAGTAHRVPLNVLVRTPGGTRTRGWESLL